MIEIFDIVISISRSFLNNVFIALTKSTSKSETLILSIVSIDHFFNKLRISRIRTNYIEKDFTN